MKRNILSLIFLAFTVTLFAQVEVSITPNPVDEFEEAAENDWVGHALVKNESDNTRTYLWERSIICNSAEFDIAICDETACYLPSVSSKEFTLEAGAEGRMDVHVYLNDVDNGAEVQITITEVGNDANTASAMYMYNVCAPLDVKNLEEEQITIFPNPATEYFNLTDNSSVKEIIIYNIVGKPVKVFNQVFNGQRYDISDLSTGLYLISFLDADNKVIKTNRLSTKHP